MHSDLFSLHADVEDRHWWFVARRQIMGHLVRQVLPEGDRPLVVDVGCGTGGNLGALVDTYECVGIDPTPEAVRFAAERFPTAQFICGYAPRDLGGIVSRARLILLMDVLEHIEDDAGMLSSLVAATSPGTYFFITVPADMSLWSPHDEHHGHYRRYTADLLSGLWKDLPVSVHLLSHFNARLYPLIKAARVLGRFRGKGWGKAGTDMGQPPLALNAPLQRVFAGEAGPLGDLLEGARSDPYKRGVSLVAVLQRNGDLPEGSPAPS